MARRNGGFIGTDGLDAPDPPTGVTASSGDALVSISFTAPTDAGTSAITGFVATTDAGDGATGSSSPITISSLTNGTAYTTRVYAINAYGTSAASVASASFTPAAAVGLFGGIDTANNGSYLGIERIAIASTGNSTDTADLSISRNNLGSCGSSTRGIFMGGEDNGNVIDFTTFASLGDATDFGDLANNASGSSAACNSTRAIIDRSSSIYYITMASEGNSSDFGGWQEDRSFATMCANDTRSVIFGGNSAEQTMDYVTIASTGNGTNFGNCSNSYSRQANGMICSDTRGIAATGYSSNTGGTTNVIVYITIASTGNSADFGDASAAKSGLGACSSKIRGVMAGGTSASAKLNVIEYVTIATTGNTTDFGDLTIAESIGISGCSNAHGGL